MAGASGGDLDNSTKIEGSSDGTEIGNVNDRLKVDFSASPSGSEPIIPADEITYFFGYLENGGSNDLTVNGSSTSVEFTAGPTTSSEIWYITELIIMLQDGGAVDPQKYGALSALTNGLLIEHSFQSVDYQIGNLKDNLDLTMLFSGNSLVGASNSFLNDSNLIVAAFRVEPEITLSQANTDVLKVTVRDNLTGLTRHRLGYRAWRII